MAADGDVLPRKSKVDSDGEDVAVTARKALPSTDRAVAIIIHQRCTI